jgi:hypothetical protein
MMPRIEPAGRCIYCGAKSYDPLRPELPLGDEHIVPLSLGGKSLLPAASCKRCEGVTSAFEGTVARSIFGPMRIALNLPTRRRRDRPTVLPLKARFADGSETQILVAPEQYPLMCCVPSLGRARLLAPRDPPDGRESSFSVVFPGGKEIADRQMQILAEEHGADTIVVSTGAPLNSFTLILCKIAQAYSATVIGLNNFHSFLGDMIARANADALGFYVGSSESASEKSDELHEVSAFYFIRGGQKYLAIRIWLFASWRFPVYHVVVGRIFHDKPQAFALNEVAASAFGKPTLNSGNLIPTSEGIVLG